MVDLEATLADISYIIVSNEPRITRKIVLPDPSVQYITRKYLEEHGLLSFTHLMKNRIGYELFKRYLQMGGSGLSRSLTALHFLEMINQYEAMDSVATRKPAAKAIFNTFIMPDMLVMEYPYVNSNKAAGVKESLKKDETDSNLFADYKEGILQLLETREYPVFLLSPYHTRYLQWCYVEANTRIQRADFIEHRMLGRGGFGEVYGCRKVDTGQMYAIKFLFKKRLKLKNRDATGMAFNERDMLARLDNRFIVCLNYAFQTEDRLCFVLDLMNGGDLQYHLQQRESFSEAETRFYAAEILLGLEHMHSRGIMYRDLKPANVLLNDLGHIKISDMGLATDYTTRKPTSAVGTRGYMAPEVADRRRSYTCTADWYSLGCTIYKLVTGRNLLWIDPTNPSSLDLPPSFSDSLKSLLEGLLEPIPENRLGSRGAHVIKQHTWFESIDWETAGKGGLAAPFIPPRGEVHAMDVFDIGTFKEDDVKGVTVSAEDQKRWADFDLFLPQRWQKDILGTGHSDSTAFNTANKEADKVELKLGGFQHSEPEGVRLQGYMLKLGGTFLTTWQRKYFTLFADRLEWRQLYSSRAPTDILGLTEVVSIKTCTYNSHTDVIRIGLSSRSTHDIVYLLRAESEMEFGMWISHLQDSVQSAKSLPNVLPVTQDNAVEGDWNLVELEGD